MHETHEHINARNRDRLGDRRRLSLAIALTGLIFVAEAAGGLLTGSLALLSDAGHMLTDLAALLMSLIALRYALRPASDKFTFGLKRLEILAALVNGVLLILVCTYIGFEAVNRLMRPAEIRVTAMGVVAAIGLVANIFCATILSRSGNINIRSAFLHVIGDLLSSIGVVLGAAVMSVWHLPWIDPSLSLVIAAVVLVSGYRVLREATGVLMEAAPGHLDVAGIRAALLRHPAVREVHDLHVWTITSGLPALSCHVVAEASGPSAHDRLLEELASLLRERFDIGHATIQLESLQYTAEGNGCINCE